MSAALFGQVVGFDTQLHMVRGPKAARLYKEERDAAIASGKLSSSTGKEQEVSVLRGGFAEFGQKHKVGTHERSYCLWSVQLICVEIAQNDAELVEKWDEESWEHR